MLFYLKVGRKLSIFSFTVSALQAVQVEVKFSTNSLRVQENVESIDLLAMRTGNVEIASIVRLEKIKLDKGIIFLNNQNPVADNCQSRNLIG